jgi:hypothetical protein
VPVRAFLYSGQRKLPKAQQQKLVNDYDEGRAPCICLEDGGDHDLAHRLQNPPERAAGKANNGRWPYSEAADCAAETIVKVRGKKANGDNKCTKECIREQLDSYHKRKLDVEDSTPVRADPGGQMKTSKAPTAAIAVAAAPVE